MAYLIGVDIGGTFTDCSVVDEQGAITVGKAPTTPEAPEEGFFAAIEDAGRRLDLTLEELLSTTERLAHGTTVGTNAVVTRRGARTGLLATRGHIDAIRIMDNTGRATGVPLERILDLPSSDLPDPFVPRELAREITERIDSQGDVVVALNEDEVVATVNELVGDGIEALAVSFLWSFMNPVHERRTAELVNSAHPGLFVSLSHEVAPKVGEYPRSATAALNAYIAPVVRAYAEEIEVRAAELGYTNDVLFMQCNGGLADGVRARELPIQTLQSGPVAGVIAAAELEAASVRKDVITTDMGGTTFDVSVIEGGRPLIRDETVVQQHRLHLNMVDIQSLGAGGGSIAWVGELSGALRVGPQSAGADPGPACYGRGGLEPTVTDADLILGILDPDNFLGGRLKLDYSAAERAVGGLAAQLDLSVEECAAGIVRIVDAHMADLIRSMTVQRGLDPRTFSLYAYGGGAGAHAGLYCAGLGISEFVVPLGDAASVWSALGLAAADLLRIYEQPIFLSHPFDVSALSAEVDALERRVLDEFDEPSIVEELRIERYASCKYGLQVYEVEASVPDGELDEESVQRIATNFEDAYAKRYGEEAGYREAGIIMTRLGLRVHRPVRKPKAAPGPAGGADRSPDESTKHREVYWSEVAGRVPTRIWNGDQLAAGARLEGPAIVEFPDTTVVVRPGGKLKLDDYGNAVVALGEPGGRDSA